jgi:hypothetical protein
MANDSTRAVSAGWRYRRNRTFEAVKCVPFRTYNDVKAFVVLIATGLTGRHN